MVEAIKIFFCYAREDERLKDELEKHLSTLKRRGLITALYDRQIPPGIEWIHEIDKHMNASQIILLLVSPDFLASDFCYDVELKCAIERHEIGEARVIPIILRPCDWEDTLFGKLQPLPGNGKPVVSWYRRDGRDSAFLDIVKGIRIAIEEYYTVNSSRTSSDFQTSALKVSQKTKEEWLDKALFYSGAKRYEEALRAYERAIELDPNDFSVHLMKVAALCDLKAYEEALTACQNIILLRPDEAYIHKLQGDIYYHIGRYKAALVAYEQALKFEPCNTLILYIINVLSDTINTQTTPTVRLIIPSMSQEANRQWMSEGDKSYMNGHYTEALATYEYIIRVDPCYVPAYLAKGFTFNKLGQYDVALLAFEQAMNLDSHNLNNSRFYDGKGEALEGLGRYEEAISAYERAGQLAPHSSYFQCKKGNSLLACHCYEEALAVFDSLVEGSGNPDVYKGRGNALQGLKRYEDALVAYEEAIRLYPDDIQVYNDMGITLELLGRSREAKKAFEKSKELMFMKEQLGLEKGLYSYSPKLSGTNKRSEN